MARAQGSARQLTHVGREQVRLLNRWTRAFAARIALEGDSPPSAVTPPVTLAAAEAPYADPFLMEFEDQSALNAAYADSPVTFEQALMAARLEAKQAVQVRSVPSFLCHALLKCWVLIVPGMAAPLTYPAALLAD